MSYALRIGAVMLGVALWLPAAPTAPAHAQAMSPFGLWGDDQRSARPYRQRPPARAYRRDRYSDPWLDDDFYEMPPSRKRAQSTLPDRIASGGARPSIAPKAPPEVPFAGTYAPGSIVIDVGDRKLYLVGANRTALAYPIGVGRDGFSWTGTETISRVASWPDWHPPKEMRQRQPSLPSKMTGGVRNPLGARAIYLGNTLYRIHGTNDPKSIGSAESSGCFRMLNGHAVDLAERVAVGAEVHVVSKLSEDTLASQVHKQQATDLDVDTLVEAAPSYQR